MGGFSALADGDEGESTPEASRRRSGTEVGNGPGSALAPVGERPSASDGGEHEDATLTGERPPQRRLSTGPLSKTPSRSKGEGASGSEGFGGDGAGDADGAPAYLAYYYRRSCPLTTETRFYAKKLVGKVHGSLGDS